MATYIHAPYRAVVDGGFYEFFLASVAVVGVDPIWHFTRGIGFSHAHVSRDGVHYTPASARQSTGVSLFGLAPTLVRSQAPIGAEKKLCWGFGI